MPREEHCFQPPVCNEPIIIMIIIILLNDRNLSAGYFGQKYSIIKAERIQLTRHRNARRSSGRTNRCACTVNLQINI